MKDLLRQLLKSFTLGRVASIIQIFSTVLAILAYLLGKTGALVFLLPLILLLFPMLLYFLLKRREFRQIRKKLDVLLGSPLTPHDLRTQITTACQLLGIDKCTIYALDKDETDLIVFFEHGTKLEYLQGMTHRRQTSYRVWVSGEPWIARNPEEKRRSSSSGFRKREEITSAMAFPLSIDQTFGIAFFNFTKEKSFWGRAGDLRWIQRWRRFTDRVQPEYFELIEHFADHLSFHIGLQRNLIDSPTALVRRLQFFEGLSKYFLFGDNERVLPDRADYSGLANHILSALGSSRRFRCGVYLARSPKVVDDVMCYELVDEAGDHTIPGKLITKYEMKSIDHGPFEHLSQNENLGDVPFVFVPNHKASVPDIDTGKLFGQGHVETYMIFPIYRPVFLKVDNRKSEQCFSIERNNKSLPDGYLVALTERDFKPLVDYSPVAFDLISDYIGIFLNLRELSADKKIRLLSGLKEFERHLHGRSETWNEELTPLLKLAIELGDAQYADLWVYRAKNDRFYLAAATQDAKAPSADYNFWRPRPKGNSARIVKRGRNLFWPSKIGVTSLQPETTGAYRINALVGYPIEGVMHSYGVIWLRWTEKQNEKEFSTRAFLLDIFFQLSGHLLTVTKPVDEINIMVQAILDGGIWIKNVLPISRLASNYHEYNEGLMLIKPPNTFRRDTLMEILRTILNSGCEIHGMRVFSGRKLKDEKLSAGYRVDLHLGRAYNIATGIEPLSTQERAEINRIYNIDRQRFIKWWGRAPEDMEVIPALKLGIDGELITYYWNQGRSQERFRKTVFDGLNKIGDAKSVMPVKISQVHNEVPFFMMNGYLPGLKAIYENETHKTIALLIRWKKGTKLTWRWLRENVIGDDSNPEECLPGSLRYRVKKDFRFPIDDRDSVNGQKNLVHVSSGPLEGMRELGIWFDLSPFDTILGRQLRDRGCQLWEIEKLLNPIYEQFIDQRKIETGECAFQAAEILFWLRHEDELKMLWDEPDILNVFSNPERRYLLTTYYFWRKHLPQNLTDAEAVATAILETATSHLPPFSSVFQTYSNVQINHLKGSLKKLLLIINKKLPDTAPAKHLEYLDDFSNLSIFVFIMGITLWLADQIEIQSLPEMQGLRGLLKKRLETRIASVAERLVSYSKNPKSSSLTVTEAENILVERLSQNSEYQQMIMSPLPLQEPETKIIAIVLAAGRGTRAKTTISKALLPLYRDIPGIKSVISNIKKSGVHRVLVAIDKEDDALSVYLKAEFVDVEPIPMSKCKGIAFRMAVLMHSLPQYDGKILLCYSDMPFVSEKTLRSLIQKSQVSTADLLVTTAQQPKLSGQIFFKENSSERLVSIQQARFSPERKGSVQDAGIFLFSKTKEFIEALENIQPDPRGDYGFADVVEILTQKEKIVVGVPASLDDEALGIDTPADLLKARLRFCLAQEAGNPKTEVAFFAKRGAQGLESMGQDERSSHLKEYRRRMENYRGPAALFYIDE